MTDTKRETQIRRYADNSLGSNRRRRHKQSRSKENQLEQVPVSQRDASGHSVDPIFDQEITASIRWYSMLMYGNENFAYKVWSSN